MPNIMLEAALRYATEHKWPIFPCNAAKRPFTENGVLEATTDPQQIHDWWAKWPRAGIGLDVGGAGMMVLDGDSYKEGFDAKTFDSYPKTQLIQRSPRGGVHKFYALAEGDIVAPDSTGKLGRGIDVRSFHSYVLLAPSRTEDGEYTWESEGKPAFRTDEMIRLSNSHREKHADRDKWIIEPDLPENVAKAINWLKNEAKPSIEGQGGDHMAYATAAYMKGCGLSEGLAFDLMWAHWNPRCVPPWSADDAEYLETKVKNGYTYNTSPPGWLTGAYKVARDRALFAPVEIPLPTGRSYQVGRYRIVDSEGMDHIEPPTWLLHDFIAVGGYALLVGAPGTFKTFIALDMALSVASGVGFPWAGPWGEIGAAGPVLFAAGEGRPGLKVRREAWEKAHWGGKKVPDFSLIDPVPKIADIMKTDSPDFGHFIEAAKMMHPEGYKLAVIDTVGRAMQGANENAQEHASKFTAMVERIQRELNCAVLGLHHTGHESGNRARGSSVFGADADTMVRLDRPGESLVISLTMTKQKDSSEWKEPKYVQLREIQLGKKSASLAAFAVEPKDAPKPAPNKNDPTRNDGALILVLDSALGAVLKANPSKAWTTKDLAEAMAMRDDVGVQSQTMRNHTLRALRETAGTKARACYDADTKRWRWRD